jgi:hypothetical protein
VVIFTVGLEVALQFVDVGGQQCNLHFWRTSVTNSLLVVGYDLSFFFNAECHVGNPFVQGSASGETFPTGRGQILVLKNEV